MLSLSTDSHFGSSGTHCSNVPVVSHLLPDDTGATFLSYEQQTSAILVSRIRHPSLESLLHAKYKKIRLAAKQKKIAEGLISSKSASSASGGNRTQQRSDDEDEGKRDEESDGGGGGDDDDGDSDMNGGANNSGNDDDEEEDADGASRSAGKDTSRPRAQQQRRRRRMVLPVSPGFLLKSARERFNVKWESPRTRMRRSACLAWPAHDK